MAAFVETHRESLSTAQSNVGFFDAPAKLFPAFRDITHISWDTIDPDTRKTFRERAESNFKKGWVYFVVVGLNQDGEVIKLDGFAFARHHLLSEERQSAAAKDIEDQFHFYVIDFQTDQKQLQFYATMQAIKTNVNLRQYMLANDPDEEMKSRGHYQALIGHQYQFGQQVGNSNINKEDRIKAKYWYGQSIMCESRIGALCMSNIVVSVKTRRSFLEKVFNFSKSDIGEIITKLNKLSQFRIQNEEDRKRLIGVVEGHFKDIGDIHKDMELSLMGLNGKEKKSDVSSFMQIQKREMQALHDIFLNAIRDANN